MASGREKKFGVEPFQAVLETVSQALGVPFPELGGRPLPLSLAAKCAEWFDTFDLARLRGTQTAGESATGLRSGQATGLRSGPGPGRARILTRIQVPQVTLSRRHALFTSTGAAAFQHMSKNIVLWHRDVKRLRIDANARSAWWAVLLQELHAVLLPELRAKPYFPSLETLVVQDTAYVLSPSVWSFLLRNCPKLSVLALDMDSLAFPHSTELDWLLPLEQHSAPWTIVQLPVVPVAVSLSMANPRLEALVTQQGGGRAGWTLANVRTFVRKMTDDGKIVRNGDVRLSFGQPPPVNEQEFNETILLLLKTFPGAPELPWDFGSENKDVPLLHGETVRALYASRSLKLPYISGDFWATRAKAGENTVLRELAPSVEELHIKDLTTEAFYRSWTPEDVYYLLVETKQQWATIHIGSLGPGPNNIGQRPFPVQVLHDLLQNCAGLNNLVLDMPCAVDESIVQQLLPLAYLMEVQFNGQRSPAENLTQVSISLESLKALVAKKWQESDEDNPIRLQSAVLTNLTPSDWKALAHWHDEQKEEMPPLYVLVPSAIGNRLMVGLKEVPDLYLAQYGDEHAWIREASDDWTFDGPCCQLCVGWPTA